MLFAIAFVAVAEEDTVFVPTFRAEIGLVEMPDSLIFMRSDSALLQYNWSVRFRVFKDSSSVPDVFNLGVKYREIPGEGSFRSNLLRACEWGLERRGAERSFYRIGDMDLLCTDSSFIMSAEPNPFFLEGLDSVQIYGVTDFVPTGQYRLRDVTDYGSPGKLRWDQVGDISDKRFDIRFVRAELLGWSSPPEK